MLRSHGIERSRQELFPFPSQNFLEINYNTNFDLKSYSINANLHKQLDHLSYHIIRELKNHSLNGIKMQGTMNHSWRLLVFCASKKKVQLKIDQGGLSIFKNSWLLIFFFIFLKFGWCLIIHRWIFL